MGKIGVILSGCGVYDGTEIHEAVLTLLYLDQLKQETVIIAPNIEQHHVINHQNGSEAQQQRTVIEEAARIARGEVLALADANPQDFDAIILPGGFGAAKNLCDFAFVGANAKLLPQLSRFLSSIHKQQKPIGALCIAPVILALLAEVEKFEKPPTLTIGNDPDTASLIEKLGCRHQNQTVSEICVDTTHKFVTTPAYMLGPSIANIAIGIEKLVRKIVELSQ